VKENNSKIPAVEKAIGVLECLCASPSPMGISELTRGMLCFAAPVFDANMDVAGALGITVLTLHHSPETLLSELACPVLQAAKAASDILGADMSHVPELEIVEAWQ
jgi:DNA-binding IclR family transcriptional regulator